MALVKSKRFIAPTLLGAGATTYTVLTSFVDTIRQFSLNNVTSTPRTVTVTIGQDIATTLLIPAAGAQPTILYGALGQVLNAADVISIQASAADAIVVSVSGIEEASV